VKLETDTGLHGGDISSDSKSRKRALVIEDDASMMKLIEQVLGSAGIDVVTPDVTTDVKSHFLHMKFDVILICPCAQSTEQFELIRTIREPGLNQKTPIIMISNDQRAKMLSEAFEVGVSFFVYKPIDNARLTKLIYATQGLIEHERRRFRRVPLKATVRIKSAIEELAGETIDISMNGTLVRASHTLPLRSLVEVSLYIPQEKVPIVGLGTVVRIVSNTEMGLLLDRFSATEMARLQECLLPGHAA
jgi:CheY-like chemotaxis protein